MDPITIWIFILATAWFVRAAAEDTYAGIRGRESPRIARSRARQQLLRERVAMTGQPTIGQAVAGRVADRIADRRPLGPARRYFGELWAGAWEDASTGHEARRRRRAREREEREQAEREQAERRADGRPDPDNAVRTRQCLDCPVLVIVPAERCPACEAADEPQYQYQPTCIGGCGVAVVAHGRMCPSCDRSDRERRDRDQQPDLDDPEVEELNDDQPPETPEPDPAPDTTRKDTPPVSTPEINGDVASPMEALASATACLDLNEKLMNEIDAMANNAEDEGVGDEFVQIIRDAYVAGEQFGAASEGARDAYAQHVRVQGEFASNPDLSRTVASTYLDTANA